MDLTKPLPQPTPTSKPFWDALRDETVLLQQCDDCLSWIFYPRTHCSNCLSPSLTWNEVSGAGRLYSYTVARQPTAPHFQDEVPQLIAIVELDVGIKLTSTLTEVDLDAINIGMRLKPFFDHRSDAVTLLRFGPA